MFNIIYSFLFSQSNSSRGDETPAKKSDAAQSKSSKTVQSTLDSWQKPKPKPRDGEIAKFPKRQTVSKLPQPKPPIHTENDNPTTSATVQKEADLMDRSSNDAVMISDSPNVIPLPFLFSLFLSFSTSSLLIS